MATYIDYPNGLVKIEKTKDGVKPIYAGEINSIKNTTKDILEISKELENKFNEIYDKFDTKNVFNNNSITESFKGKRGNMYKNFILFCNFLLNKIKNTKKKKELKKIPQIISNLRNYKGGAKNKNKISEKISEVMNKYNEKNGRKTAQLSRLKNSNTLYYNQKT